MAKAKERIDLSGTSRFGVSMSLEEHEELRRLAELTDRSVSEQLRAALRFYMANLDEALQDELDEKAEQTKKAIREALSGGED